VTVNDDGPATSAAAAAMIASSKREQVGIARAINDSRETRVGAAVLAVPRAVARARFATTVRGADMAADEPGRRAVRVAAITDAYSEAMLAGAFDTVHLHPLVWRRQIDRFEPDVLFVESAWTGHGGGWRYEISHRGRRRPDRLGPVLEHCRRLGVPTVFWNKEDPVGFVRFFAAAQGFDLVATTDDEAASWYRSMLPGTTVAVLPFPLNPTLHHPVLDQRSSELGSAHPDRVVFAGSWTNGDYPERVEMLERLLGVAAERNALHIYTRRPDQFPAPLRRHVQGELAPTDVWRVSKRYAATVNVNSVPGSRTMLARRVVESLGSGLPVISSPTPAASHLFGELVIEAGTPAEMHHALDMVFDPVERSRRSALGWRVAHRDHTVDARLADLFALVGVEAPDRVSGAWSIVRDVEGVRAATRFAGGASAVLAAGAPSSAVAFTAGPWQDEDVLARRLTATGAGARQGLRLDEVRPSTGET
jgi:hypothetical protein